MSLSIGKLKSIVALFVCILLIFNLSMAPFASTEIVDGDVYYTENENVSGIDLGEFTYSVDGASVTFSNTTNVDILDGFDVYVAVFDWENQLLDVATKSYTKFDANTTDTFKPELKTTEGLIRTFIWKTGTMVPYDIKQVESTVISPTTGMAVVMEIGANTDEAGEDIYKLTLLYDGEEDRVYNTNADVYAKYEGKGLTVGDVVKFKISKSGVITNMTTVFDFEEKVRAEGDSLNISECAKVALGDLPGDGIETFDGGYVTDFNKRNKKVFSLVRGTSGIGEPVEYNLMKSDYIYGIDGVSSRRGIDIYDGSPGDFDWEEELVVEYSENDEVFTTLAPAGTFEDATKTGANYADIILVRTYEGAVAEAIIIKGSMDYRLAQ